MYYTLHIKDTKECLGVYTSIRHCSKGLDIYLKDHPESKSNTFYWIRWEANTVYPESWEWAYISLSASIKDLTDGGAELPIEKYWGKNIIEVEWEVMELQ